MQALDLGSPLSRQGASGFSHGVQIRARILVGTSPGRQELLTPRRWHARRGSEHGCRALTLRLFRWISPMELDTVFGPSSMRVLRGHSVLTRWCSPMRILRTFSAPVTRISGLPSKCVLNTLPYFSLRDDWKPEPCRGHARNFSGPTLPDGTSRRPSLEGPRGRGGGPHLGHQFPTLPYPTHTHARTNVGFIFHSMHENWEVGPRGIINNARGREAQGTPREVF